MKFLKKNYKLIIIALLFLFLFKSMQSCMRKETVERVKETKNEVIDSIKYTKNNRIHYLEDSLEFQDDSIKALNHKINLYKQIASSAEQRAIAVQSTAEKIKSNTTIKIEDQREKIDSLKNSQKN